MFKFYISCESISTMVVEMLQMNSFEVDFSFEAEVKKKIQLNKYAIISRNQLSFYIKSSFLIKKKKALKLDLDFLLEQNLNAFLSVIIIIETACH